MKRTLTLSLFILAVGAGAVLLSHTTTAKNTAATPKQAQPAVRYRRRAAHGLFATHPRFHDQPA